MGGAGVNVGTPSESVPELIGKCILDRQSGELRVGYRAAGGAGENGESLVDPHETLPVDLPGFPVKSLFVRAVKPVNWGKYACTQPSFVIDAVKAFQVCLEMDATTHDVGAYRPQLGKFGRAQGFQPIGDLGKIVTRFLGHRSFSGSLN